MVLVLKPALLMGQAANEYVCLFGLLLNAPVNSYGHVGKMPPFYGTFTQNEDVMISNKCLKCNHTSKPQKAFLNLPIV